MAFAALLRALQHWASSLQSLNDDLNLYSRLSRVESRLDELSRGETIVDDAGAAAPVHGATVDSLLYLIDGEFAAPTTAAKFIQFNQALDEISFDNGMLPSDMLTRMYQLVRMMRTDSDANSPLIWEETRGRFTAHLETQAESHSALRPFVEEMAREYFADKSYSAWIKQFKTFEDSKAFRAAYTPPDLGLSSSQAKILAAVQALNDKILAVQD